MSFNDCMKQACDSVTSSANSAKQSATEAEASRVAAKVSETNAAKSATDAEVAANLAQGVVIPTGATYSIDSVDDQMATVVSHILINSADIVGLQHNMKGI